MSEAPPAQPEPSSETASASAPGPSNTAPETTPAQATEVSMENSNNTAQAPHSGSGSTVAPTAPNGDQVNAEAGPSSPPKVATSNALANDSITSNNENNSSSNTAAGDSGGDIEMTDGEKPAPSTSAPASAPVPAPATASAQPAGPETNGGIGIENGGEDTRPGVVAVEADGGDADEDGEGEEDSKMNLSELFAAKREEEMDRRDRSLAEFLVMLDGYKPLIPEEITEYYLQRAGFECSDPRLKRLLSLSAQKFVSDLSRDAYHFAKLRTNGQAAGRGRPAAGVDRNRVVLTMEDLSLALGDHGVNVKKPDYCEFSPRPVSEL
ncbi:hypothetical protein IAU59_000112 [Kwoniella sp. CBS 9459]